MHISASVARASASPARGVGLPRPADPRQPATRPVVAPPLRLRFVLVLALAAWGLWSGYPRMQSAFQLHSQAVATADYALCMVGPTGPTLIRDRESDFLRLVRRRLIASAPTDRPFQRCGKLAKSITQSVEIERFHGLPAVEFREYGGRGAALSELAVSAAPLSGLLAAAWPFARGGYTQLMKSSLGAAEAAHVPAPPRPSFGRGLPARSGVYRNVWSEREGFGVALGAGSDTGLFFTPDLGVTFRTMPRESAGVESHAERCSSQDPQKTYRLTPREDGAVHQVLFGLDAASPQASELAPIGERVLGTGCDERSLVVLTADRQQLRLRVCPFAGRCGELALPAAVMTASAQAVDVAKIKGTVVLSVTHDGVVRVISSRDEGRTFTPPVVAFDATEYPELALARRPPARLLALNDRLLLFGGPVKGMESYPVLVSDDQGVSFRAP